MAHQHAHPKAGANNLQEVSRSDGNALAKACLRASHQLRRSTHRQPGLTDRSRAVSLATCHLLDSLSRALVDDPHCLPPSVAAAMLRLSERIAQLPPTPDLPPRIPSADATR